MALVEADGVEEVTTMRIFHKDGIFSKTSVILVATWAVALFKWLFQGAHIIITAANVDWTIVYISGDAIIMTGAASTLYFAVHNVTKLKNGEKPPPPGT